MLELSKFTLKSQGREATFLAPTFAFTFAKFAVVYAMTSIPEAVWRRKFPWWSGTGLTLSVFISLVGCSMGKRVRPGQ
jgi:hypothetical protein